MCILEAGEERRVSRRAVFNTRTTQGATSVHALAAHRRLTYWRIEKTHTKGMGQASLRALVRCLPPHYTKPCKRPLLTIHAVPPHGPAPAPSSARNATAKVPSSRLTALRYTAQIQQRCTFPQCHSRCASLGSMPPQHAAPQHVSFHPRRPAQVGARPTFRPKTKGPTPLRTPSAPVSSSCARPAAARRPRPAHGCGARHGRAPARPRPASQLQPVREHALAGGHLEQQDDQHREHRCARRRRRVCNRDRVASTSASERMGGAAGIAARASVPTCAPAHAPQLPINAGQGAEGHMHPTLHC